MPAERSLHHDQHRMQQYGPAQATDQREHRAAALQEPIGRSHQAEPRREARRFHQRRSNRVGVQRRQEHQQEQTRERDLPDQRQRANVAAQERRAHQQQQRRRDLQDVERSLGIRREQQLGELQRVGDHDRAERYCR
jgi:hypothetical protein